MLLKELALGNPMFLKILLHNMIVKKENVKNGPCFDAHTVSPTTNTIAALVTNVKAQDTQLTYSSPLDLVFLDTLAIQVHQAYPEIRRQY